MSTSPLTDSNSSGSCMSRPTSVIVIEDDEGTENEDKVDHTATVRKRRQPAADAPPPAKKSHRLKNKPNVKTKRGEQVYTVADIIAHKEADDHTVTFLVQWVGFAEETWEPERNMAGSDEVVSSYWERVRRSTNSANHNLPEVLMKANLEKWLAMGNEMGFKVESVTQVYDANKLRVSIEYDPDLVGRRLKSLLAAFEQTINLACTAAGEAPIRVVNEVDLVAPPSDFTFITSNVFVGAAADLERSPIISCDCSDGCGEHGGSSATAECCAENDFLGHTEAAYNKEGKLVSCIAMRTARVLYAEMKQPKTKLARETMRLELSGSGMAVVECNSKCSCVKGECSNRVVQRGRQVRLRIAKTLKCGWGAFAEEAIACGTFISGYVGEVVDATEVENRMARYSDLVASYIFDIDNDRPLDDKDYTPMFSIDAATHGNVSRFFNHSCDPNMISHNVWTECHAIQLPNIAFFAARDIKKGEQLCFDYKNAGSAEIDKKHTKVSKEGRTAAPEKCHCGAARCRGEMF